MMETKEAKYIPAKNVLPELAFAMGAVVTVAERNCSLRPELKSVWLKLAQIRSVLLGEGAVFSVTMYDGENWDSRETGG